MSKVFSIVFYLSAMKELRHGSRLSTEGSLFCLLWVLYVVAATTPLSSHFPFFSWALYTGVPRVREIFDVRVHTAEGSRYLYSAITDVNRRRNFQILLRDGRLNNEYLRSLISTYVTPQPLSFERVRRSFATEPWRPGSDVYEPPGGR